MNKDKFSKFVLPLFWVFAFLVIIFLMSFSSYASSPYFPMTQNKNSHFSGAISLIENQFDAENNYYFVIYRGQNLSLMTDYAYIVYFPKSLGSPSLFGEVGNQTSQFSLYKIGNVEFTFKSFDIYWQGGTTPVIRNISVINNSDVMWRTFYSSNYDSGYDYISNFRVYTDNSPDKEIILNFTGGNEYDDPGNDTYPNNAGKPDINDYIDYNDFPTFDSSDGIRSLWNIVKYSFGVVIPGLGNYIVDSINWGFQKVINNIRNVVKNVGLELQEVVNDFSDLVNGFLSDIRDFLFDINDFVEYITEPLDLQEVETSLSNSITFSLISVGSTFKTTYKDYFDSINAPSTLSFSIPYTILNKSGYITFDFAWYAGIRDSVIPWIVGFLYMGFGLALFRSFPSIIHGVSGILQKGG